MFERWKVTDHLTSIHIVNEVFATAFYRNLAPSHPVYKVCTIFKKFFLIMF